MLFTNLRRQLSFLIGLQNDHWNWRNCVQHSPADLIHLHLTMELFEIIASNNQKQTIGEFMTSLLLLLWYFLSPPQYRGDLSVPCSFDLCVSFFLPARCRVSSCFKSFQYTLYSVHLYTGPNVEAIPYRTRHVRRTRRASESLRKTTLIFDRPAEPRLPNWDRVS